jgi:hypothetical protein
MTHYTVPCHYCYLAPDLVVGAWHCSSAEPDYLIPPFRDWRVCLYLEILYQYRSHYHRELIGEVVGALA